MGLLDKIIFSFSQKWWGEAEGFLFIWTKDDMDSVPEEDKWITILGGPSRPAGSTNTLTLWTHGDQAKLVS